MSWVEKVMTLMGRDGVTGVYVSAMGDAGIQHAGYPDDATMRAAQRLLVVTDSEEARFYFASTTLHCFHFHGKGIVIVAAKPGSDSIKSLRRMVYRYAQVSKPRVLAGSRAQPLAASAE